MYQHNNPTNSTLRRFGVATALGALLGAGGLFTLLGSAAHAEGGDIEPLDQFPPELAGPRTSRFPTMTTARSSTVRSPRSRSGLTARSSTGRSSRSRSSPARRLRTRPPGSPRPSSLRPSSPTSRRHRLPTRLPPDPSNVAPFVT